MNEVTLLLYTIPTNTVDIIYLSQYRYIMLTFVYHVTRYSTLCQLFHTMNVTYSST